MLLLLWCWINVYKEIHVVLVNESHKIRSLCMCEKFPIGCSPHKDQVLSTWVIPPKTHESFISFVVHKFWEVVWVLGCTFWGKTIYVCYFILISCFKTSIRSKIGYSFIVNFFCFIQNIKTNVLKHLFCYFSFKTLKLVPHRWFFFSIFKKRKNTWLVDFGNNNCNNDYQWNQIPDQQW
jgi:hypothetical protein